MVTLKNTPTYRAVVVRTPTGAELSCLIVVAHYRGSRVAAIVLRVQVISLISSTVRCVSGSMVAIISAAPHIRLIASIAIVLPMMNPAWKSRVRCSGRSGCKPRICDCNISMLVFPRRGIE